MGGKTLSERLRENANTGIVSHDDLLLEAADRIDEDNDVIQWQAEHIQNLGERLRALDPQGKRLIVGSPEWEEELRKVAFRRPRLLGREE